MTAAMFASPPLELKQELNAALGPKADEYWITLNDYLTGRISRVEYDEQVRDAVDSPELVQLHNALIISVLASSSQPRPPTPPPSDQGKMKNGRKRKRGGQAGRDGYGDDYEEVRLRRWALGMGRKERERVQSLASLPGDGVEVVNGHERRKPRPDLDEIARERGVILIPEGKDPAGTYLPVHLASVTRAPTLQHIHERITLISAQHNLGQPARPAALLLMLACEAKLKQLITQALTLTSTSHAITSIQLSTGSSRPRLLSTSAFEALFTVRPAVLPNQSAAAMRLALGEPVYEEIPFIGRHVEDPRWQMLALLAERSTVKEALMAAAAAAGTAR